MTNKIPQEIEEKILKDVFDDLWDYRWNQNYEEANKMLRIAIQKGFKAGQKQKQEDMIKLNGKNQAHIKRQSNQINLLLEKVSFLKDKLEELKSKLSEEKQDDILSHPKGWSI